MIQPKHSEKTTDRNTNCLPGHTKFMYNELTIGEMCEQEEAGRKFNRKIRSCDPIGGRVEQNNISKVVSTGIGDILEVKVKFRRSRDKKTGKMTPDYVKLQATASQKFPVTEESRPYILRPPVYSISYKRLDDFTPGDTIYVALDPHMDDYPFGARVSNGEVKDITSVDTMLTFDISVEEEPNNVITKNGIVTAAQS